LALLTPIVTRGDSAYLGARIGQACVMLCDPGWIYQSPAASQSEISSQPNFLMQPSRENSE